ncbi:MAG: polymer-forming cytoskeletal protein [Gammaproteobacteria bacterium]|jgi:cytoskeletal protein CcmA (bactofilin family)|nr:MAG: polymer-forming cytoskeletal protein [Gammaproteobacteria bacterium]
MFEKRKDNAQAEPEFGSSRGSSAGWSPSETFNTRNAAVIGATIRIKGEVSGDENLLIEGNVVGSVALNGHDLTIGQKGIVEADLTAKTVKVEGQVTGDIQGEEKVILTQTGRVRGNITAPRVTLEDGAKFKGAIDMDPGIEKPAAAAPKRAATPANGAGDEKEKSSQTSG